MPLNKPKDKKAASQCSFYSNPRKSYFNIKTDNRKLTTACDLLPVCREGQLEGHLSGSVCEEAPNIDKHRYTCLAASPSPRHLTVPHNIHQQMKNKSN